LDCELDVDELAIMLQLLKNGEHPEAVAALVKKMHERDRTQSGEPTWN
jgi:hypothetical protein